MVLVPQLAHTPLLPRRAAREVLDVVASTWQPTAAVDVRRMMAAVLAHRPVRRLHRVHRPSLAEGLQVLVDHGEGMQPFRRDQREVVAALRRLVGSELDVRRFLDDPWAGTRPDDDPTWSRTYRPELDGAWRRLAAVLAGRASAVAALVPLRRPGAGPVDVVAWDPLTWPRAVARLRVRRADGPA